MRYWFSIMIGLCANDRVVRAREFGGLGEAKAGAGRWDRPRDVVAIHCSGVNILVESAGVEQGVVKAADGE